MTSEDWFVRHALFIVLASTRATSDVTNDVTCSDHFSDCASVIPLTNVCTDPARALQLGCQLSCGLCPTTTTTTTTTAKPCVDTYLQCFTVAKLTNLCSNRTSAEQLGCLHTCNFCGVPCQNNPTACNHGTCRPSAAGGSCVCDPGYTGIDCFTEIDECGSNPCRHGGVCTDLVNGFSCTCSPGYTGIMCEFDIDECHSNPCAFGTCADKLNGFVCNCLPGFQGLLCNQALVPTVPAKPSNPATTTSSTTQKSDICWDSPTIDCRNQFVQKYFCAQNDLAVNYCRKTCNVCDSPWMNLTRNSCGDLTASVTICQYLDRELCLCHDDDIRVLCANYCAGRCGTQVKGCTDIRSRGAHDREASLVQAARVVGRHLRRRGW